MVTDTWTIFAKSQVLKENLKQWIALWSAFLSKDILIYWLALWPLHGGPQLETLDWRDPNFRSETFESKVSEALCEGFTHVKRITGQNLDFERFSQRFFTETIRGSFWIIFLWSLRPMSDLLQRLRTSKLDVPKHESAYPDPKVLGQNSMRFMGIQRT